MKERLSLSIPAIRPITSNFGWTCPLPHLPHAAKSFGPKRLGMEGSSIHANDLHALADPVRRKVYPTRAAALRHDLLDHLLTEDLELRLFSGTRHLRNSPHRRTRAGRIRLAWLRLSCSYAEGRQESIRRRGMTSRRWRSPRRNRSRVPQWRCTPGRCSTTGSGRR